MPSSVFTSVRRLHTGACRMLLIDERDPFCHAVNLAYLYSAIHLTCTETLPKGACVATTIFGCHGLQRCSLDPVAVLSSIVNERTMRLAPSTSMWTRSGQRSAIEFLEYLWTVAAAGEFSPQQACLSYRCKHAFSAMLDSTRKPIR